MEKLEPEQQQRRERADQIREAVNNGTIADINELDPRETSAELVHEVRGVLLRKLGTRATR
jgi:hypothetical protein